MPDAETNRRQRRLTIFGTVALLLFGTAIAGVTSFLILSADSTYTTLLAVQVVCTVLMFVPAACFLLHRMRFIPGDEYSGMTRPRRMDTIYIVVAIGGMLAMQPLVDWAQFVNEQLCYSIGINNDELRAANNIVLSKMLDFSEPWKLAMAVIVIGIIPAVVEELFFRVSMQQYIRRTSGYTSFSIVSVAVVFSLFHGEVEAFLSRMLLGVLLGLLYEFTRSAYVPMLAHATNNVAVVLYCYYKTGDGQMEVFELLSAPTENPGIVGSVVSVVVVIVAVYWLDTLRKQWQSPPEGEKIDEGEC